MPVRPHEFISAVLRHFDPITAICRERKRFGSDEELLAFLRRFPGYDGVSARVASALRDVGILIRTSGEWFAPPFLNHFIDELYDRQRLASPEVVQAWVKTLEGNVRRLDAALEAGATAEFGEDFDLLLEDVGNTFHQVVQTVESNCLRISSEIKEYRRRVHSVQDARMRLHRLCRLHDEYLDPVVQLIKVHNEFYSVTEALTRCCSQIADRGGRCCDHARRIVSDVLWLRDRLLARLEEASAELGPLREIEARESMLATGINRALDSISNHRWDDLALHRHLSVVEERSGNMVADSTVRLYLHRLRESAGRTPPIIGGPDPVTFEPPPSEEEIIDQMRALGAVEDVMEWLINRVGAYGSEVTLQMFHSLLQRESEKLTVSADEQREYTVGRLLVQTCPWKWEGGNE